MEPYKLEMIETVIVIVLAFIASNVIRLSLKKVRDKFNLQKDRVKYIVKIVNTIIYSVAFVMILFIWGVNKKELVLFLSSFLAVIGIALFAQWSILSNVTASILLYINHPAKIGDTIVVMDKDFPLTGKIKDIGAFFIRISTDKDEVVTIPNSIIFQKMVKIVSH